MSRMELLGPQLSESLLPWTGLVQLVYEVEWAVRAEQEEEEGREGREAEVGSYVGVESLSRLACWTTSLY